MTTREFLEQLCEIIGGEDAMHNYTKDELLNMLKIMATSHEEIQSL